jgi:hypothetical protein
VSVHVAFDIYPAATPNGSLLVRLLASGTGTKQAVELSARKVLHGSGEGMIRIHSSHAAATSANFTKRNYVKVVLVNGATETEWFGFFLEQGDFGAISRREQAGRMLTFSGPGSLFYLDRALLLAEIYAPGQPRRGNLELDGQWGWNDIPYGAIMTRAMEEGYYAPGNPLFYATWDFSRTQDSAAVAWPNIDNEFTVPWGTSVYDLIASFIKLGLVVTVDADLTFHAWQTYGTNRTSATFAANKIRFAHGVNIGNEVTRQIRASLERSHIFVVGDEFTSAVVSGGSSAVTYYDTLQKQETNDSATLTAAGDRDLAQREIQADAAFPVRVILDDDELNGLYVPGEHYDVGDIATIHTVPPSGASGEHDFTNFAIEVAAIKVEHDDAGNWFAVNELGAQYLSAQLSALEVPSSKIIHQIELCRHVIGNPPVVLDFNFEAGAPGTAMVVNAGDTDRALYAFLLHGDEQTVDWCVWEDWGGGDEAFVEVERVDFAPHVAMSVYRLLNPSAGDGLVHASVGSGTVVTGIFYLSGVDQTTPEASVVSGSGASAATSLTIAPSASGIVLDAYGAFQLFAATPTPGASQTQAWLGTTGLGHETGGSYGGTNPSWTLNGSHNWVALAVEVSGGDSVSGDDGPMPVGANGEADHGTAIRATRCDHVHPHSDLSDHSGETHHHAASSEVTPFGTIAATNVQAALEEIVSEATGAPTTADYLVGTAQGGLSAEIVVGTTPGGELGNTWASPTVDATHAGSNHLQPVRKNSTGSVFTRRQLNFIEGSNVTLTVADDAGNDEVDITIAASGSGGTVTVEEVDGTPSVAASTIVFPNGTLTDNGGGEVQYTPTGGGGGDTVVGNVLVVYPDSVQAVMPTDGSNTFSPSASAAWLYPIQIPGKMLVRSLLFRVETAGTGTFQWGLFYTGSDATAATKVAGGSGALNATGWVAIPADSAPVSIDAGGYMIVWHVPAANRPTLRYTDHTSISPTRIKFQTSYTWDDTPNFTSGWSHDNGTYIIALKGDLDASNQW